jgi:hypothetical protein
MEFFLELLWRGGPLVVMALFVASLAYWSIGQGERNRRRKR